MAGRKNAVRGAVAVNASGSRRSIAGGLCVHAVRVCLLRGGVAIGAGNFGRRLVVSRAVLVLVAIDTPKHFAMNGVLELILVDEETYRLAIFLFCQGRVGVAGEAVRVLALLSGARV
jgi:hypothetical protein